MIDQQLYFLEHLVIGELLYRRINLQSAAYSRSSKKPHCQKRSILKAVTHHSLSLMIVEMKESRQLTFPNAECNLLIFLFVEIVLSNELIVNSKVTAKAIKKFSEIKRRNTISQ